MTRELPVRALVEGVGGGHKAVAVLYNAFLTGLILTVAMRRGPQAAGDMIFRVYRQHHHDKFLSSLEKLGIHGDPPAVLAAKYHYLSNSIGGVRVQYMPDTDAKAWVRFVHPRWVYQGAAICGVPLEVSRGMLQGWYAENGPSLGNPRLGFVCTSEDMDGQYGLAGYFQEYDRDLEPAERLRFAPGEQPPRFDPAKAPSLDLSTWPPERLAKANRNYAMAPVRLTLPIMVELFGQDDAAALGRTAAKLIGLQFYEETAALVGQPAEGAAGFGAWFQAMAEGQGDRCTWEADGDEVTIRQTSWRLMQGVPSPSRAVFEAWNGLWEGALLTHDRELVMEPMRRMDFGDGRFEWRIRRRGTMANG